MVTYFTTRTTGGFMKPHIERSKAIPGYWVCYRMGFGFDSAYFGKTPKEAYLNWKEKNK